MGCYPGVEFLGLPRLVLPEPPESVHPELQPLEQLELPAQARPGLPEQLALLRPELEQQEPVRPLLGSVRPGRPSAQPLLASRLGMPHEAFSRPVERWLMNRSLRTHRVLEVWPKQPWNRFQVL